MVYDEEGNLTPDPAGITLENPLTGRAEPIPVAALDDRIRELGHFTCADPGVDQSFNQIVEECNAECDVLARKKLLSYQLHQIITLSSCQRIAHRARYSTTASLNKVQSRYFSMLSRSMRMHSKFPNNLRFGSPKFGGLGLVSFDDMVFADRVTAIFRHHFRGGQESDILAGAIKRSELLHQSRTPILERTDLKLWDGTWIGRIAMSLSGSNLSIRGGQTNHGFRDGDVALADLFEEVRERRLVQEGCKKFGLHWLSQIVSEDGSTWAEELQVHKKHFNGSFSYPFYSVNGLGERTKATHTVRSTTWLSKVKTAAVKLSPNLGTYHAGCKPELQEFDVILFPGDPVPRIVLVVQEGKVVSLSTVSGMNPSRHKHTDAVHRRWNTAASCGPGIRSSLSSLVYSVDDTCTGRCDPLHKAIKVEVQLLPRQGEIDFFHWIRLEDLFESGDVEWSNPLVGGVFFRTCVDEEWLSLQSESVGVSTVNRFQIWSQSECWAEMDKVCGIDCFSPNLDFGKRVSVWKNEIQKLEVRGAVLAGGDASYFAEGDSSKASFGYGFFGIGPADEYYWNEQPGASIHTLAVGGGVDWRPPRLQNNVRSEIQHMMMVMYLALKFELPVLYSVDLLHAAEGFNSVLGWTVSYWIQVENRDLWECILHLRRQLRAKRILFKVFHNRGHPEVWSGLERCDYTALMEVAHRTDILADEAMEQGVVFSTPELLGRRRWRLYDGDVEVVGPIRRSVREVRAGEASARYMLDSRRGEIAKMHTGCWWAPLSAPSGLGQRLQLSKFLFDWWAVKLNQVKKGQTEDIDSADECTCGHPETQLHLLLYCTTPEIVVIRRLFERKAIKLVSRFSFSSASKRAFKQCFGLTPAGTCPDWGGRSFVWPAGDLASALRASMDDPIGLFRKGLLPVEFLKNDRVEIEYSDMLKFGKLWFRLKRDEAMMIWRARNGLVHQDEEPFCWATLRSNAVAFRVRISYT
jgi:hypothetical protein